jgi:predicted TIM-barrel fold metal-dependent hydrolase
MPMPKDIGVIDLMMSIPISDDNHEFYEFLKPRLRDTESREGFKMPAQYMFKDIPTTAASDDKVAWLIGQMDAFGIDKALVGGNHVDTERLAAMARYPGRLLYSYECDPNNGLEEVRRIRRLKRDHNLVAVTAFPAGTFPQVAINDARFYPIYAACAEEGVPIFVTTGIAGPRFPSLCQKTELIEEVVYFFPELTFVMRHGAEPWEAMAVKLMVKYPNLYYSTSAFAPKHYPKAIIDYANSRGSDKIMYAGYFPMGLSLERSFAELANVPFKDEVWPKFLRGNAMKVLGLES